MNIKVLSQRDESGGRHIHYEFSLTGVYVHQDCDFVTRVWKPAEVNWPGCGSSSVAATQEFIEVLQVAMNTAKEWTEERAGKKFSIQMV